jgi:hypothetical protein
LKEDRLLAGHHLIGFHVAFEDSAYARTLQWNFKEFRIRQIARQCSTPFARPTATPDRGAPRQRALAAYQIGTEAQYQIRVKVAYRSAKSMQLETISSN